MEYYCGKNDRVENLMVLVLMGDILVYGGFCIGSYVGIQGNHFAESYTKPHVSCSCDREIVVSIMIFCKAALLPFRQFRRDVRVWFGRVGPKGNM